MNKVLDWRSLLEPLGLRACGEDGFIPATEQELKELRGACGASAFSPVFVEIATSLGNIAFHGWASIASLNGERFSVSCFYGGAPDDLTLLDAHESFVENSGFPSYWVPFAHDPGGQKYVFDSRDVVAPVCIDRGDPVLIPIANSFDEFIMGLRRDSD